MTDLPKQPPVNAVRWLRFSLVGALGICVQLSALALLTHWRVNYLAATFLAVETAVLHNFVWHERYTWRDRGYSLRLGALLGRLARFHAANAFISLAGNLVLMRLLVGELHMPVLAANAVSIASCGLANFLISDRWVFLEKNSSSRRFGVAVGNEH